MNKPFETTATVLVDQHYAAGPDAMKRAIAAALEDAARQPQTGIADPRARFKAELAELEKTSERGSE